MSVTRSLVLNFCDKSKSSLGFTHQDDEEEKEIDELCDSSLTSSCSSLTISSPIMSGT
uniref:Uncharacterized protein n=1 Tax=Solanum lycopersicum TaxID=4081 RepID=A0A3Q7EY97_SOLLC